MHLRHHIKELIQLAESFSSFKQSHDELQNNLIIKVEFDSTLQPLTGATLKINGQSKI